MGECLFCRMIKKEISAKVEHENRDVLIIQDIHPQAPHHLLVIPKTHVDRISEMAESDQILMGKVIYQAKLLAEKKGWSDYRLVFNNGAEAGQSVFHIHLHLLSGRRMAWPPG